MQVRTLGVTAGILGFTGVAAGAFAAHALEGRIDAHHIEIFQTGARYHLIHALALLAAAYAAESWSARWGSRAGILFTLGVILFSGSLYLLALTGTGWLGAITPLGGAALLSGWLSLVAAARDRGS